MSGMAARVAAAILTAAALMAAVVAMAWPEAAGAAPPAAGSAAAGWTLLTEPEGKFAVELPGTPTVNRWTDTVGDGLVLENVEYLLAVGGDEFTVGAANFKMDLTEEQMTVGFKAAVDDLVAKAQAKEAWRRETTVSGRRALEAEYSHEVGGVRYRTRVLITFGGQRLYSMSVRQPETAPTRTAERAIRSLRLL